MLRQDGFSCRNRVWISILAALVCLPFQAIDTHPPGGGTHIERGSDMVADTLNQTPVTDHVISPKIGPGPIDLGQSVATVPTHVTSGVPFTVTLQAFDALGNMITTGGESILTLVSNPTLPAVIQTFMTDHNDGTYSTDITMNANGSSWTLEITGVPGSPWTFDPLLPTDPAQSTAMIPPAMAGEFNQFTIQAIDTNGDPRPVVAIR